jgi:hypothetical protein
MTSPEQNTASATAAEAAPEVRIQSAVGAEQKLQTVPTALQLQDPARWAAELAALLRAGARLFPVLSGRSDPADESGLVTLRHDEWAIGVAWPTSSLTRHDTGPDGQAPTPESSAGGSDECSAEHPDELRLRITFPEQYPWLPASVKLLRGPSCLTRHVNPVSSTLCLTHEGPEVAGATAHDPAELLADLLARQLPRLWQSNHADPASAALLEAHTRLGLATWLVPDYLVTFLMDTNMQPGQSSCGLLYVGSMPGPLANGLLALRMSDDTGEVLIDHLTRGAGRSGASRFLTRLNVATGAVPVEASPASSSAETEEGSTSPVEPGRDDDPITDLADEGAERPPPGGAQLFRLPWVRLSQEVTHTTDLAALWQEAHVALTPEAQSVVGVGPWRRGTIELLVAFVPDETGYRQQGLTPVLLMRSRRDARRRWTTRLVHVSPAGPADLAARHPAPPDQARAASGTSPSPVLSRARVAVIGLGALGHHVALDLARAGVGSLHLVDGDIVTASPASRQYPIGYTGQFKPVAAAHLIAGHNPYTRVSLGLAAIGTLGWPDRCVVPDDVDLVVDATADLTAGRWLALHTATRGLPLVQVSAAAGALGGLVLALPSRGGGCYRCLELARFDGTLPAPPSLSGGWVFPGGCATATFTGYGHDLALLAHQATRTVLARLLSKTRAGSAEASVEDLRDYWIASLPGDGSPATWAGGVLTPHPACPQEHAGGQQLALSYPPVFPNASLGTHELVGN